jgi:hypothetical protein
VSVGERRIVELQAGRNFYPLPASMPHAVSGPALMLGHGLSLPELGHDDYSRVDARGAVVFALDGAPDALLESARDEREELTGVDRKLADAAAHGAAALVVIDAALADMRSIWAETGGGRDASYRIYPPAKARLAAAAVSDHAAEPILEAIRSGAAVRASLVPGVIVQPITVHNVVGRVEGAAAARPEMVVVGAHLDHDGVDDAGTIYNGADDNASGTAAVLAMAAAFTRAAERGARPDRTVLFALWNAEEQGSLGAEAFVRAPRPDLRIVANINLDMIGRDEEADPANPRFHGFPARSRRESDNLLHVLGYSRAPALAELVEVANRRVGLDVRQEYDVNAQNLLQRSDHWVFLRRGIPAIFLTTGLHPDYHRPSDDVDRVDFEKLERITELAARVAWLTADAARFAGTPAAADH